MTVIPNAPTQRVYIIGCGLAGSAAALMFARAGAEVVIYDARSRRDLLRTSHQMSISMTLAERGARVLDRMGLLDQVEPLLVPLRGRQIHRRDGQVLTQRYGHGGPSFVRAVQRADLLHVMLGAVTRHPRISLQTGRRLINVVERGRVLVFQGDTECADVRLGPGDLLIGADGTHSRIRDFILHGAESSLDLTDSGWSYREVTIPAAAIPSTVPRDVFHMWPAVSYLILAVSTPEGALNCTVYTPSHGRKSVRSMIGNSQLPSFIARACPDIISWDDSLPYRLAAAQDGPLCSLSVKPWSNHSNVVLIGDACHTFLPFYGQGMNASLEDAATLVALLKDRPIGAGLDQFEKARRADTDLMQRLSYKNFVELRVLASHRTFQTLTSMKATVRSASGGRWLSAYDLVMGTDLPYGRILRRRRRTALVAGGVTVAGYALSKLRRRNSKGRHDYGALISR